MNRSVEAAYFEVPGTVRQDEASRPDNSVVSSRAHLVTIIRFFKLALPTIKSQFLNLNSLLLIQNLISLGFKVIETFIINRILVFYFYVR